MAPFRKVTFKILGPTTILMVVIMWLCLPVYWGSRASTWVFKTRRGAKLTDSVEVECIHGQVDRARD